MRYQPGSPARRILSFVLSLCACLILQATTAKAQDTVTGAFEGTVTNSQTGAPIPGASVQIINQLTEVPVAKRTGPDGRFYQGLLPPGVYTLRASAPGYKTREKEQRLLATQVNQVIPVPIQLDPETAAGVTPTPTPSASPGATPTPTPTSTAPTTVEESSIVADINTTDARRGGAFTEEEVSALPLGASTLTRTFDELALLLPGVADPPQTLGVAAGPGIGPGVGSAGQFSVNGLRSRANNFTVDGSDNNDEDIGVRRQGFFSLVPQSVESIKEYQVVTLLAPAQYGRNIGAQVNAISKSGGNKVHGTFYGFFNPGETNSRNFFDTISNPSVPVTSESGQPVIVNCSLSACDPLSVRNDAAGEDPFRLLEGGFALGGPIMRDKWYFFFSGERQTLEARREVNFAVPTVDERGAFGTGATGIFRDPLLFQLFGASVPQFAFPTTLQGDAIFSLFPFPNNPNGVYGPRTFTQQLPADARGTILSAKTDVNFKAFERQQSFTVRYNFTHDQRIIPVTGGALFSSIEPRVRTQNISTFLNSELSGPTSTSPMFNQLRLSYGRTRLVFDEVREQNPEYQIPSDQFPDTPFLLNAPLRVNTTLPDAFGVPNSGPVFYFTAGTSECGVAGCPGFIRDGALGPLGQVNVAGFSPIGVDVFNFPQRRVNNTYQVADNLSWRKGSHSLTFGLDIRRTELNSDLPRNSRTLLTFNGAPQLAFDIDPATGDLVDFHFEGFINPTDLVAARAASGTFQTLARGDSNINLRYYQLNFFAQDEWRIRPNLSLSFGLRYEYNTVPRESSRLIEDTFDDPAIADLIPNLATFIDGRTGIFDPDRNNFAPRIGIAYSPNLFGSDRATVIRAGYGLFYDQILGAVVSQSRNVFPRFLTLNTTGGLGGIGFGVFDIFNTASPNNGIGIPGIGFVPYTVPGTINTLNPNLPLATVVEVQNREFPQGGFGITLPARQLDTPAAHHFSVTFEQQLSRDMAVSAAYVGTRGRNLLRLTTPNLGSNAILLPIFADVNSPLSVLDLCNLDPTNPAVGFLEPCFLGLSLPPGSNVTPSGAIVGGRPLSGIGVVNIYETTASSDYDSLQLQLRGRFQRKLKYQVAYTFSKSTDDVSDVFDLAGASALPQNSLTFEGERGPSNFDARHRFSYNFIWDLPEFRDHSTAFRKFFGGFALAGTGRFQTGQPFTVNSIFDVNLDGNLTDRLNSLSGIEITGDRRQPIRLAPGVDPTTLLAPIGTDGIVGRNTFRAGNILELNLAVIKNIALTEKQKIVFRVDFFNITNRANFGVPVRFLEAPGFGEATDTVTPGRRIQFALKYSF